MSPRAGAALRGLTARLADSHSGNVAVILAFARIAIVAATGVAVDDTRAARTSIAKQDALDATSPALSRRTDLQGCASSSGRFFLLTSANDIVTTFRKIGHGVSELRTSKQAYRRLYKPLEGECPAI